MLSVARVSTHQGRHYYTRDNYYSKGEGVEHSAWWGEGARALGLEGQVEASDFQALLEGYDPSKNHVLSGRRLETNHRAALDLTFSAPKSVSLAALVGGNLELEVAHQTAVETALKVAESRYAQARAGNQRDRRIEVTGNLVVARFQHDTSRAKDPQLHTHCVVINTTHRSDGRWRALYDDDLHDQSKLLGLVYQDALLREVRRLGFKTSLNGDGTFEIEGYSEAQKEAFSKRYRQIKEAGLAGHRKEDREAKLRQRTAKGPEIPRAELQEAWRAEAEAVGIKEHPGPSLRPGSEESETARQKASLAAIRSSAAHNTERDVAFRRERLETFAMANNLGAVSWQGLQRGIEAAKASGELVSAKDGRFTTAAALRLEADITAALAAGTGQFEPICQPAAVQTLLSAEDTLTAGQKEAVGLTLSSRDQFIAWQGVAGAGKTFALSRLRPAAEAAGLHVKGFAPSAEAAKVLAEEGGIEAQTVAAHLAQGPKPPPRDQARELWFVDEAGLLASRDTRDLMDKARIEGARVVFVGDRRQLSGVEAGNPFKLLQKKGIATAHLSESRRQKEKTLKEGVDLIAQGEVAGGLKKLGGFIHEFKKEETRAAHVAREYLSASVEERRRMLLIAGTNRERREIATKVRDGLKAEGSLDGATTVKILRSKDLTREELAYAHSFRPGDIVVFHKTYRSAPIIKGEKYEVVSTDKDRNLLTLKDRDGRESTLDPRRLTRKNAYAQEDLEIATGELMKWTKNDHGAGRRNGQEFRVTKIEEGRAEIQYKTGERAEIDLKESLHVDHNYVTTTYSSQGKTSDHVLIATDHTFTKEAMYVALSRARHGVQIFTENKEQMAARAETSRSKLTAEELLAPLHEARLKVEQEKAAREPVQAPELSEAIAAKVLSDVKVAQRPGRGIRH
jgi:conjugative relaxase-like TrwC/TraI family protein